MVIKGLGAPFRISASIPEPSLSFKWPSKSYHICPSTGFWLGFCLGFDLSFTCRESVDGVLCALARLVFHYCFPSIGFAFRLSVLLSSPQLMPGNFPTDFWHGSFCFTSAFPSNGSAKRLPGLNWLHPIYIYIYTGILAHVSSTVCRIGI